MKARLFSVLFIALFLMSATTSDITATLQITILDNLGNIQPGANVTLYNNEKDYLEDKNALGEAMATNEKGKATFKKLKPAVYFIKAEKGKLSNRGAGVKTQKLAGGKVNKMNIVISE